MNILPDLLKRCEIFFTDLLARLRENLDLMIENCDTLSAVSMVIGSLVLTLTFFFSVLIYRNVASYYYTLKPRKVRFLLLPLLAIFGLSVLILACLLVLLISVIVQAT